MPTVSFKVTDSELSQIQRAADQLTSGNLSQYCVEWLIPRTAELLGEPVPARATPKSRVRSPVTIAALQRGMTREQYRQLAVELLAEADLRQAAATSRGPTKARASDVRELRPGRARRAV